MANKAVFLRVGLLVLAGIAATVGVVLFLGKNQVRHGLNFETYFKESVQGLDVGAPVKFRGVTLGQVSEIALVSAAYPNAVPSDDTQKTTQLVVVRYAVDPAKLGSAPEPGEAVKQGLRARLASQGLTGLAYLELDFVDPQKFPAQEVPWEPEAFYIPSMPSTVSQVQDALTLVLDRLKSVDYSGFATRMQAVLEDLHEQMTTGDVHAMLADAAGVAHTLREAMDGAHLDEMAADLRATTAGLRQVAGGRDMQTLVAKATQAVEQLAEASKRLPALLTALQGTIRHTDDGLSDVTTTLAPVLRDARAAAANLRDTSEALRRYPAGALLGGPPARDAGQR
jgi:paraquat-inducible protein B